MIAAGQQPSSMRAALARRSSSIHGMCRGHTGSGGSRSPRPFCLQHRGMEAPPTLTESTACAVATRAAAGRGPRGRSVFSIGAWKPLPLSQHPRHVPWPHGQRRVAVPAAVLSSASGHGSPSHSHSIHSMCRGHICRLQSTHSVNCCHRACACNRKLKTEN
jgi:hypothetical protein